LRAGLLGVAAGEALGLPWAGVAPRKISRQRLLDGVGPTGAMTTALLAAATGGLSPNTGGANVRGQSPNAGGANVGGQSPNTGGANVGGQSPNTGGANVGGQSPNTGGANVGGLSPVGAGVALAMALAVGWREPEARARRAAALPLGFAAVVVADVAASLLAGRPVHHLVADHADDWPPPFHGVGADGRSVVDALLEVLHRHDDPTEGMRAAVRLGGDGAAVLGAVVGGVLGSRRPTAIDRIPWLPRVSLPDDATLDAAVAALSASPPR
jgi:hypothetical protein